MTFNAVPNIQDLAVDHVDSQETPERFNLTLATCTRWTHDRRRFALYYEDAQGATSGHTFWDIQRTANQLSNVLAALGAVRGDRVAIVLSQCPQAAIAHMACYQMGIITVPIPVDSSREVLLDRLARSEACLAIIDVQIWPTLITLRQQLPNLKKAIRVGEKAGQHPQSWLDLLEYAAPHYLPTDTAATDSAMLLFKRSPNPQTPAEMMLLPHATLFSYLPTYVATQMQSLNDPQISSPQPDDVFWSPLDWGEPAVLWFTLLSAWYFGVPVLACSAHFDATKAFVLMQKYAVKNACFSSAQIHKMMAEVPRPAEIYDLKLGKLMCVDSDHAQTVSGAEAFLNYLGRAA
ncbi:MAG: AMP-binding protein [Pseudomonadota bacterium]